MAVLTASLTPAQMTRVRELFEAASTDAGVLRSLLDSKDAEQRELGLLVETMLRADSEPQPSLDTALRAAPLTPSANGSSLSVGDIVGAYKIVRELGAGGMGTVYLAESVGAEEKQQFALKLVKGRLISDELLHRFAQEQAILSRLEHPNIAKLFDIGWTKDGCPYLLMEYVEGKPVDEFCDDAKLSVDDRLKLFIGICDAVAYLHQNLVIHRDLKPGNVLVTANGTVKLVDFGIARLLEHAIDRVPAAVHTQPGFMTPEYASPEQIQGRPLSTLVDVYGLGVLLYELLTGRTPFVEGSHCVHELLRRICEDEPEKPSGALSDASSYVANLRTIRRRVRGELDNIVLKALKKQPEQRYASVQQLLQDVRRHEDGLPVSAHGQSALYQLKKLAIRHRTGLAGSMAVLAALITGLALTTREAQIANNERVRAEAQATEARRQRSFAEQQMHIAESERAIAQSARKLAEQNEAAAQLQTLNAERRLHELQSLSSGLVRAYKAKADADDAQSRTALMARSVRDSLLALNKERTLEPSLVETLDAVTLDAHSYELGSSSASNVPRGWMVTAIDGGKYQVGTDHAIAYDGKSSLFVRSLGSDKGQIMVFQTFSAERYRGKRVCLSAFLRSANF
ncbi:MAG: protein kinase, partial [Acidobacteriaceae bacterium]|nr:protein kinase [Acidobacteriaceae bacterium]